MITRGEKASVLIEDLQRMIAQYGDRQVIVGGTDYPEGYKRGGVRFVPKEKGDGYVPGDSFLI